MAISLSLPRGQLENRLHGLETEYGVQVINAPKNFSAEDLRRIAALNQDYFRSFGGFRSHSDLAAVRLVENIGARFGLFSSSPYFFLPNGALKYLDEGFHPEYSTPECSLIRNTVHGDLAGEILLEEEVGMLERAFQDAGIKSRVNVFKNNSDTAHLFNPLDREDRSYGCHEDYTAKRDVSWQRYAEALMPFLVTRQIYSGAGRIARVNSSGDVVYHIGARSGFFYREMGMKTMGENRSIINTRDEPHADAERYRRLHVITGDSNMSPVQVYLKLGTTAMVLSLIEEGLIDDAFITRVGLKNPVYAIRQVARDMTCKQEILDGLESKLSALWIQRQIFELALKHRKLFSAQYQPILDKWGQMLDILEKDPMDAGMELDWVGKWIAIDNYVSRGVKDIHKQVAIDLKYHNIIQGRGLVRGVIDFDEGPLAIDQELVRRLVDYPPENEERARFRGYFEHLMLALGLKWDDNWRTDWVYISKGQYGLPGGRDTKLLKEIHGYDQTEMKDFFLRQIPKEKLGDPKVQEILTLAFPN